MFGLPISYFTPSSYSTLFSSFLGVILYVISIFVFVRVWFIRSLFQRFCTALLSLFFPRRSLVWASYVSENTRYDGSLHQPVAALFEIGRVLRLASLSPRQRAAAREVKDGAATGFRDARWSDGAQGQIFPDNKSQTLPEEKIQTRPSFQSVMAVCFASILFFGVFLSGSTNRISLNKLYSDGFLTAR